MFLVTSPIVINVPTRGLLAVETMHAIVRWLANLNIKRNMTSMFVNKKHRYSTYCSGRCPVSTVSIRDGLRTADYGLRTTDYGLGIKHGLRYKMRTRNFFFWYKRNVEMMKLELISFNLGKETVWVKNDYWDIKFYVS